IEPGAEVEQQFRIEAGADLACVDEVTVLEVPDEQRAEADAAPLRISKSSDDQLLAGLALHLQPVGRTAMLVGRIAALGDDAFPALAARTLPRRRIVEPLD